MLRLIILSGIVLGFTCLPFTEATWGQATSPETSKASEQQQLIDLLFQENGEDDFVYKRERRSDPFVPFVKTKVAPKAVFEEELTGMQKFEPGQLTLVAIVSGGESPFAMVEDSLGMGYIIRKGTKIGRSGVVENIVQNKVIIKMASLNLAGDKRFNNIEMVLKSEGEE